MRRVTTRTSLLCARRGFAVRLYLMGQFRETFTAKTLRSPRPSGSETQEDSRGHLEVPRQLHDVVSGQFPAAIENSRDRRLCDTHCLGELLLAELARVDQLPQDIFRRCIRRGLVLLFVILDEVGQSIKV